MDQGVSLPAKPAQFPPRRLAWFITGLGLVSLILFLQFYDRAFPAAAIDLVLSRAEIEAHAQTYLEAQGYHLANYEFALTFTGNSRASYYLQRQLGIPETNRLTREERLPIWYWRARWYRPLQKEEFQVHLATDGRIVALSHILLEDEPGASLSQEAARTLASQYLTQDRGWSLDEWEEVTASSTDLPGGRTDHTFEWKRLDWNVGESELRLTVMVKGDAVGFYDYWLKAPESYHRELDQQQTVAGFVAGICLFASFFILIAIVGFRYWKTGCDIITSPYGAIGPAVVAGVVMLLGALNVMPLAKAGYDTTTEYTVFWLLQGLAAFLAASGFGFFVFVLWGMGRGLGKLVWPRQDKILSRRGDRWQLLARSSWRGLMLGLIKAGYLVLFYLLATEVLGWWTPMGPDYSDIYATPLPFLGALSVGLMPALWEEFVFRLMLISAVMWLLRSCTQLSERWCRLLALFIPGALFAFAHVSYLRDPLYLRGIELILVAVLLDGLFLWYFDLTTTMVAHFMYNAGLAALPLLRSSEPAFVLSGLVVIAVMLAPVVPGALRWIWLWLRGRPVEPAQPGIRSAQTGDEAALEAFPIDDLEWDALLAEDRTELLCLEVGDELVGVAAGRVSADSTGEVLTVQVVKAWRRQYWASELVQVLRGRLEARGVESLKIEVGVDNKDAGAFWLGQEWKPRVTVFGWPPEPPSHPRWEALLRRLRTVRPVESDESGGEELEEGTRS